MTAITEKLHRAFLRPLGDAVLWHSPAGDKAKRADLQIRINKTWWPKVPIEVMEEIVAMPDKVSREK